MDENIDNTMYIAEQIFCKPPKPKNSIDLQLEEETEDIANTSTNKDVFIQNIIASITFHGVYFLYGHRNIVSLTENQFYKINEYVESYGYTIIKKIVDNNLIIKFEKIY